MLELCEEAVAAALGAGASYADARVVVRRSQVVGTRNRRVERLDDSETQGIGVRVLVDGAWGFAGERQLDATGAQEAARKAVAFAKAAPGGHVRALAPVQPARGEFRTVVDLVDAPILGRDELRAPNHSAGIGVGRTAGERRGDSFFTQRPHRPNPNAEGRTSVATIRPARWWRNW